MVNINELRSMPISQMAKIFHTRNLASVNLRKLAQILQVSVLERNFETMRINGEKILSAFVTNEKGHSCIFFSDELNGQILGRIVVTQAFARYIITGKNNFFITQSTIFSNREKVLINEMLMPESEIEDVLGKLILPTTFSLADIFQVPQEFVIQRLHELNVTDSIAGYNF